MELVEGVVFDMDDTSYLERDYALRDSARLPDSCFAR